MTTVTESTPARASGTEINACAGTDTLTVYWNKPDEATADVVYEVQVHDIEGDDVPSRIHHLPHTHCTIDGLEPEHSYDITVSMLTETSGTKANHTPLGRRTFTTGSGKHTIDVTDAPYNAVGDGRTLNTAAIQRALDDCGPDDAVLVPDGVFLTGALRMHANTELVVANGAVLQGTANPLDYLPMLPSRFEGIELDCYASLITVGHLDHNAEATCRNVVIRGGGTIAGGGRALAEAVIERERGRVEAELAATGQSLDDYEKPETIPGRVHPRLITIANASHVELADVTFANGASWTVHMIYSDHIVTHGCAFRSHGVWNGDGWDPDSSEDCTIFDCDFDTGDDIIAIKSGKNPEGNVIARPTRHIRIFNCRASEGGHALAIGSEMSGGVEDVDVWDCDLSGLWYGVEVKTTLKRGGWVRGLRVRDAVMRRAVIRAVPYNDDGIGADTPPVLEGFRFERVRLLGGLPDDVDAGAPQEAIHIQGLPAPAKPIRNVVFHDVTFGGRDGSCNGDEHDEKNPCGADDESGATDIVANRCEGLEIRGIRCAARGKTGKTGKTFLERSGE